MISLALVEKLSQFRHDPISRLYSNCFAILVFASIELLENGKFLDPKCVFSVMNTFEVILDQLDETLDVDMVSSNDYVFLPEWANPQDKNKKEDSQTDGK